MNRSSARVARFVWIAIVLLQTVVFVTGIVVLLPALQQVCTLTALECQQRLQLSVGELSSLQNLGYSLTTYTWYALGSRLVQKVIGMGIGLLLFVRKPNDVMAWVASIFLIVGLETSVSDALVMSQPDWWLATRVLAYIGSIAFPLFFYIFPTGNFLPRWTRWAMVIWAIVFFISTFFPESRLSINQSTAIALLVGLPLLASLVVAQIMRYRNWSDATTRLQTRWIVVATVLGIAALLVSLSAVLLTASEERLFHRFWILQDLGFSLLTYLLPIAIAIAILRYRLFDIDLIIRKTLQYALVTGLLALVYFGSVVLLQAISGSVTGEQSPVVIVLSTLLIAALFTPLRRRVQVVIDRRFFRQKYDAQLVLAAFALTARDETDLIELTGELQRVVVKTLQPETVSLWLVPTKDQ